MQWLCRILSEIYGLFVDDGRFAVAIVVWLAVFWILVSHLGLPRNFAGPMLFLGLAGILVASAAWQARQAK